MGSVSSRRCLQLLPLPLRTPAVCPPGAFCSRGVRDANESERFGMRSAPFCMLLKSVITSDQKDTKALDFHETWIRVSAELRQERETWVLPRFGG